MCVRVHGRAPRSPARPAPASCSPLCDASRIPNARSHPPGRSHSRTHAHTRARTHTSPPHTRLRTPDSRPPGALTKAPGPGPPEPPERGLRSGPAVLPGWPRLRSPGAPSGVPAPSPCPAGPRPCSKPDPGRGARLRLLALPPRGAGSLLLACSAARSRVLSRSFLSPFSVTAYPFISSPFSHLHPPRSLSSVFPAASLSCRRPLPRLLPTALRCPHILRITWGAARHSPSPGCGRTVGGEGTRRARAPPPPRLSACSSLLAAAWRAATSRASLGCR